MPNIELQLHVYKELKARLRAANPELAEDDQALLDTLEGATDLRDGLIALMRQVDMDEALAAGIPERIKEMQARKARLTERAEKHRSLILWAIQESGIPKIEAPEFTIGTARATGTVIITDQSQLPDAYLRKFDPEPDKKAIADAMKRGETVPGATKSNGGIRLNVSRT